jgi:hypothetical protein
MTSSTRLAILAALGLGLAACGSANVQPPISGTQGNLTAPQQAAARDIAGQNSPATTQGTPVFSGATGSGSGESVGRPVFTREGEASGNLSTGTPAAPRPYRSRN